MLLLVLCVPDGDCPYPGWSVGHDCRSVTTAGRSRLPVGRIASTAEVILGLVFVFAATAKTIDGQQARLLLRFLFPTLDNPGWALKIIIIFEWVIGIALISGVRRAIVVPITVGLLAVFSGTLAYAGYRGFSGSCGCFAISESVHAAAIRNGVLVLVAVAAMSLSARSKRADSTQQGGLR